MVGGGGPQTQSFGDIITETVNILNMEYEDSDRQIVGSQNNCTKRPFEGDDTTANQQQAKTSKITSESPTDNLTDKSTSLTSGNNSLAVDVTTLNNNTNNNLDKSPNISNTEMNKKSAYELNKNYRYNVNDKGPFYTLLESSAENGNIGRLHKMSIGKLIYLNFKSAASDILDISSVGKNRIKIETKTYKSANSILDSPLLVQNKLRGYIPETTLFRKGIIRQVDTKLSIEEILTVIQSPLKIVAARRITRKSTDTNAQPQYINTQSVILTFRGQFLPDAVSIYGARCTVVPYVYRVTQCLNCLRFGHVGAQCKSSPRCSKCSGYHLSNSCNVDITLCASCKGNHPATDRLCPEYVNQTSIKKYMAYNNVGFFEAKTKHRQYSDVAASLGTKNNERDFPPLATSNRYQVLGNIEPDQTTPHSNYNPNMISSPRRYTSRVHTTNTPYTSRSQGRVDISADRPQNVKTPQPAAITRNPYPPQPHLLASSSNSQNSQLKVTENLLTKFCDIINSIILEVLSGKDSATINIRQKISDLLLSNTESQHGQ